MKMKRQLAAIAAFGLVALSASDAQAVLLEVILTGSAITQEVSTNRGIVTFKERKTSVGSKDLLEVVGTIKGIGKPPDGSSFVYDTEATVTNVFTIRDKNGNILADCTGVVVFERDPGATKSGKEIPYTGEVNTTTSFFGTLKFAPGNANQFIISGLTEDKLSVSAIDKHGVRKVSENITMKSGTGPASIAGQFGTAEGTVTFKTGKLYVP
jgi:hypothetical protein